MRALLLSLALVFSACGDDASTEAPSTDLLLERSDDDTAPTDAAALTAEPINEGEPGGEAAGDTDLSRVSGETVGDATPVATADAPDGTAPPSEGTPADTPAAPPATPTPAPAQPAAGTTAPSAQASAMWTAFRSAVSSRNTTAIAGLIADPVRVDGQSISHADFADRLPGGDVGAFVANFGGSLSPSGALSAASGGGFNGMATATTEDGMESALVFRIAPDTDGTWRVVEISQAG